MVIFPTFFFKQWRPGKCLLRYSRTKKRLSRLSKQEVQKVEKLTFFRRGEPWFWSKNGHFSNFFFSAMQARKMSLRIFQNEKTPFQTIKTRSSKTENIDIFSKVLTHGFDPKMVLFPTFFFLTIKARKMSFTIFQNEKQPFQTIKKRSSKSRKIDIFLKGLIHGFGPKMAIFPTFIFQEIQVRKMPFTIFLNKKTPFQAIKQEVQKVEKLTFF